MARKAVCMFFCVMGASHSSMRQRGASLSAVVLPLNNGFYVFSFIFKNIMSTASFVSRALLSSMGVWCGLVMTAERVILCSSLVWAHTALNTHHGVQ